MIFELVVADLKKRDEIGHQTYGKELTGHDGRDSLWDAYEESLDLAVYLRKAIYERDNPKHQLIEALLGLRLSVSDNCWCGMAIGNPMMRTHSAACQLARKAVEALSIGK